MAKIKKEQPILKIKTSERKKPQVKGKKVNLGKFDITIHLFGKSFKTSI